MDRLNSGPRKMMRRTALALSLGILSIGQSALAQSNCKEAKGNLDAVHFNGDTFNTGTLSNAGWLNGTTRGDLSQAISFPLPGVAVWAGSMTITTNQGQLKTKDVYLVYLTDIGTKATVIAAIDAATSTGIFARATGTLFLNTTTANIATNPQTFQSEVRGQVCFAK